MVTGWAGKTTLHAFVAAIEALTTFTEDEQAFMVAYHAALNAGATTKQYDSYFFNVIAPKIVLQADNY